MADQRARRAATAPVSRPNRRCASRTAAVALQAIEDQRQRGEPLASGPQHVGRADIARADLADVALAGEPGQHQPERDRPEQIAERQAKSISRVISRRGSKSCGLAIDRRHERSASIATLPASARASQRRMRWTPRAPSSSSIPASAGCRCSAPTRALLPNAPIVYAADSAGFPYGKQSEAEIAARVPALLGRLVERFHPRLVVIACNTASTIALDHVRAALDLPIVGTVPAIKPAAELSKTRVIGVLGTEATVVQPYVDDLAAEVRRRLHDHPPRLARAGRARRGQAARRATCRIEAVTRGRRSRCSTQPGGDRIDTVVLACTHFPLLERRAARRLPATSPLSTAVPASPAASPI